MLSKNNFLYETGIGLFLLLVALPFIAGIIYAAAYATGLTGLLSKGVTLEPLRQVLLDGETFRSMAYSLYITLASIIPAIVLALLGVVLFKDLLVRDKAAFLLYLPLCIPAIVAAFISFQLLGKSGYFSRLGYHAHLVADINQFPDLVNDRFGIGIILTHTIMATPFLLIYFSNLYQSENIFRLSEIAGTLGASPEHSIRKIMIPLLLNKARPTILLYGIFVMGSYEIPLILGRQSPQMISVLIVQKAQHYNLADIPKAYCIALLSVLLVSSMLFLFIRSNKTSHE